MRTLVALVALLAACGGGEGKCEFPPCEIPPHRCSADADCFQTEFCDFEDDSCGANPNDEGFCILRPHVNACEFESPDLVCGCDGVYHNGECAVERAGTDRDAAGNCPLPPNAFSCGRGACILGEHICIEEVRAVSNQFSCLIFPPECSNTPSCACFSRFGCDDCIEENGAFRVTCEFADPPNDS